MNTNRDDIPASLLEQVGTIAQSALQSRDIPAIYAR